jgi:hypothetical protein
MPTGDTPIHENIGIRTPDSILNMHKRLMNVKPIFDDIEKVIDARSGWPLK